MAEKSTHPPPPTPPPPSTTPTPIPPSLTPTPLPLDFEAGAGSTFLRLRIGDRRVATLVALAAATAAGTYAVSTFYNRKKEEVERSTPKALEGFGARIWKIWSGSIFVDLYCDTEDDLLTFVEAFETKKVEQRLQEEFGKIGFKGELEVTIENEVEVYEKVKQIRQEREKQEVIQKVGKSSDSGKETEGETSADSGYATAGAEHFIINPSVGSMEGGQVFAIRCSDIPEDVTPALATFENLGIVPLERMNTDTFVGTVPASSEPRFVRVMVKTKSGHVLGNTEFRYEDEPCRLDYGKIFASGEKKGEGQQRL